VVEKDRRNALQWYRDNHARASENNRRWAKLNPEKRAAKNKRYDLAHPEHGRRTAQARNKRYQLRHPDRFRESRRRRQARRIERDINFRIRCRLAGRICQVLKRCGARKSSPTFVLTGCDSMFLRGFIEARFQTGMSWENYGKWQIDHIIPCAEFDLTDEA
jgi:hypothetical protein